MSELKLASLAVISEGEQTQKNRTMEDKEQKEAGWSNLAKLTIKPPKMDSTTSSLLGGLFIHSLHQVSLGLSRTQPRCWTQQTQLSHCLLVLLTESELWGSCTSSALRARNGFPTPPSAGPLVSVVLVVAWAKASWAPETCYRRPCGIGRIVDFRTFPDDPDVLLGEM